MDRKNGIVAFWLYSEIIDKVLLLLDNFDTYTKNHCLRVGMYTGLFIKYLYETNTCTKEMQMLHESELKDIVYAAFIHDLGKAAVFADIIKKDQRLTEEDWCEVKEHPKTGAFFFFAPGYENIRDGILMHHERFDGTGYPFGYSGRNISLCARIISIVDSFDAMTDKRPYAKRPPMTRKEASKEILKGAGSQFDPELAMLFVKMCHDKKYKNILAIKNQPGDMNFLIDKFKEWIHDKNGKELTLELVFDSISGHYSLIKKEEGIKNNDRIRRNNQ